MKNRAFLICLVLVLILVQAMLRSVETDYLTAGATDMVFGAPADCGMAWSKASLTFSLPFAVFTAGALVAALGAGAACFAAFYDKFGDREPCNGIYSRLSTCALWCGWPIMAACTASIFGTFPNAAAGADSLAHSSLFILLAVCAGVVVACHWLARRFQETPVAPWACVAAFITVWDMGRDLLCGSVFSHALTPAALSYPLAGLALAYGVRKLCGGTLASRAVGAVLIAAAVGCACHFFGHGYLFHTDIPFFGVPCYIYTALTLAVLAFLMWLKYRALLQDEAD